MLTKNGDSIEEAENMAVEKILKLVKVSAPSKIILHGEHAVVYGKTAVAASIGLRTRMTLTPKRDDSEVIKVHFPDVNIENTWERSEVTKLLRKRPNFLPPGAKKRRPSESLGDLKGLDDICHFSTDHVDSEFLLEIRDFLGVDRDDLKMSSLICFFYLYALLCDEDEKYAFPALDISVDSDIPIGLGLGSSGALSVCLAAGLLAIRDQIFNIENDKTCRLAEICHLAKISEQILHWRCSGIDNSVSTYGGLIQFTNHCKVDNEDLARAVSLRILLVGTNVPRNTKHQVESVRQSMKEFPDIVKPIIDSIDAVSKECVATFSRNNTDNEKLFQKLGKLIDYNQGLLYTLGVSHPSLDRVVSISQAYGLHAKLTGAGGGGYAFVLIPSSIEKDTVDKVKNDLCTNGFECWETDLGVKGVEVDLGKAR